MLQRRLKQVQFDSSEKVSRLIFIATFCVTIINHVFICETTCLVVLALFCLGLFKLNLIKVKWSYICALYGTIRFHLCFNPISGSTRIKPCWNYLLLLHFFSYSLFKMAHILTSRSARLEERRSNEAKTISNIRVILFVFFYRGTLLINFY